MLCCQYVNYRYTSLYWGMPAGSVNGISAHAIWFPVHISRCVTACYDDDDNDDGDDNGDEDDDDDDGDDDDDNDDDDDDRF